MPPVISWFRYDGPGSITDPLSYTRVTSTGCTSGSEICAIQAEVQSIGTPPTDRPVIDQSFALVIQNAEQFGQEKPNVKLKN